MNHMLRFRFLLCDLDDTLYPMDAGIMKMVGERINRFMIEHLDIPPKIAPQLRNFYHQQYGTSMRGLILHYGINPESYLEFVHDLPLEQSIQPNPALDAMLSGICLSKVIITNASREHAQRVLSILGVAHHFEWIVDVRDFGYCSKPHRMAYQRTLHILAAQPGECIIVEDMARNLVPALQMGMTGVLVSNGQAATPPAPGAADYYIGDILDLRRAIQPLLGC
jgi:putative hydrolase of the HAD superfamily